METDFITASMLTLGINLIYTLISLTLAIVFLILLDKILLKNINLQEEIKKGNIAAAIFASSMIIFVAVIIASGVQ